MTNITSLTCDFHTNPLGLGNPTPSLSWQMQSERAGARQVAYRIVATSATGKKGDVWDSGRIERDSSVQVPFGGKPLTSRQRVVWRVTVWDELGDAHTSTPAWFEAGLLNAKDWRAKWIGGNLVGGARSQIPAPHLRKQFVLAARPAQARLHITALGLYQVWINGKRVGSAEFAPGWTDYAQRVQVQTYDMAALLRKGENTITAVLGDGWAVGHTMWNHRQAYVDRPRLLAQLESGDRRLLVSDASWRVAYGPLLNNDFMMGEDYDARLELGGWQRAGFDDRAWSRAIVFSDVEPRLRVPSPGPAVRAICEIKPVAPPVDKSRDNQKRFVYDFGQNLVGRVRLMARAPRGTTVTLRFAEVLNPDGTLYIDNLRSARCTDHYTFKGEGIETWEPAFTYHGFRFADIAGLPEPPAIDTLTGVVLHSEMQQTGSFECSDPLINQLQKNIEWGQRGNFVDIPTDCPQRDERLGWTGDIQMFARTAVFNFDTGAFIRKWLTDLTDAQHSSGSIPPVAPIPIFPMTDGGPAWADAIIICPWTQFLCLGDRDVLATNYEAMTRFMQFLLDTSPDGVRCPLGTKGWPGFGDWLSMNADTPLDLIGTAFLAYDAQLMTRIAEVLDKPADAAFYRQLHVRIRTKFAGCFLAGGDGSHKPFVRLDPARGNLKRVEYGPVASKVFDTRVFAPTQTSYVLALHFDLLPEAVRATAVNELAADIALRGNHLSTGFIGTPYLTQVLSDHGRTDVAYDLLNQKTWPSWLYPVTQGATTIWERWDGYTSDNGFQSPGMNSFNHYAYGAVGAWLYGTVAGIQPDPASPGYKHSVLRPHPGGGLTHASASLQTPYGALSSAWRVARKRFSWQVTVPANTTAMLHLPPQCAGAVTLNGKRVSGSQHMVPAGQYTLSVEIGQ